MNKKLKHWLLGCAGLTLFSFSPYYYEYVPILMSRPELEKSIAILPAQTLENPGKLYAKGDTLYIIEKYKGIHVILNQDPTNPIIKHFIRIPGIVDLAVKQHALFADNAVDLISIDIADLGNAVVLDRERNVFPELTPPNTDWIPWKFSQEERPSNTIIVEWKMEKR